MRVLRDNKESLMAVLEAFVHDPLIGWRLLTPNDKAKDEQASDKVAEKRKFTFHKSHSPLFLPVLV